MVLQKMAVAFSSEVNTVNSEIFAIILFSWIALKDMFMTLNIRD